MTRSAETRPTPSAASLLRGTLTLKLLVPCIVAVFLLGAALLMERTDILRATNGQLGSALIRYIDIYISDAQASLESIARLESRVEPNQFLTVLRQNEDFLPRFERILLIDGHGTVRASFPSGFTGVDFPALFARGSNATISRPVYSHESDTLTVFVRTPTARSGMIAGELNLEGLRHHLSHFAQGLEGTQAVLSDGFGNLISHPDMSLVRTQTNIGDRPIFRGSAADPFSILTWRDGRLISETMIRLPRHDWRVILSTDLWTALSDTFKIVAVLEILLIVYFITLYFSTSRTLRKGIIRPIVAFSRSMATIAVSEQPEQPTRPPFQELGTIQDEFHRALSVIHKRETQLRESQSLLEQSQRIAHVGSWQLDVATDHLTWSDETCRIFGVSQQDFGGTPRAFFALVHPEDTESVREAYLASTMIGNDAYDIEHRIVRPGSGEIRHVHQRCVHERDASGSVVRSTGMIQDITDRKQTETLLSMIMDSIPAQIYVMDPDSYEILFMNKRVQEYHGPDCTGKTCWQFFRRNTEPCPNCPLKTLTGPDAPATVIWEEQNPLTGKDLINMDTMIPWLDGRQVKLQVATDVSALRRAEAALAESEKRFRTLLEDVQMVAVQGYDQERRVTYWNRASEILYGFSREEALGRKLEDLIIPDFMRDDVIALVERWIHEGIPIPAGHLELRRKDGSLVPVYSSHAMFETTSGIKEMFCIDVDHSEIRATHARLAQARDAAEAANRAKSEFLANMSHEIRTPLNGILGMLQLLEATILDKEQLQFCALAIQSTNRLTALLSDILDLSRVEARMLLIRSERFNVPKTLAQTIDLYESVAVQTGVALTRHLDPALPQWAIGDSIRLQQVLTNLIGNAFKFTQKGHVHVEAYPLPSLSRDTARIFFAIADTGCGIADEEIDTLFRPFTQISQGYTRNHQGAGLGLTISKQLVTLMGGDMTVESEEGVGTTFYFCVTVGKVEDHHDIEISDDGCVALPESRRILLAEDDETTLFGISRLLKKSGYSVAVAHNGQEVIEMHENHDFDLILMDVQMPVLDGIESTRRIRKAGREEKRTIPIIALTAYTMAGDRERFLEAGMNDFIAKPVDFESLLRTVADTLTQHRSNGGTEAG
jgi:PAS domain S-box-containing protein